MLVLVRSGAGIGRAVGRPDAQLAADRLLRRRPPPGGVLVPSRGQRRRVSSSARSRRVRCRSSSAGGRRSSSSPSRRSSSSCLALAAEGAGARRPGAQGDGRVGEAIATEEPPPSFARGVADGVEDRGAAPHLVRDPVPRGVDHRLRLARRAALRPGATATTTASAGCWPRSSSRSSSSASLIGGRVGTRLLMQGPGAGLPLPPLRGGRRRAWVPGVFALVAEHRASPSSRTSLSHVVARHPAARHLRARCRWPSRPGPGRWASRWRRTGRSPGSCCVPAIGWISRQLRHPLGHVAA